MITEKKPEEQFVFITGASQGLGNPFAEGLPKRKI